MATGVLPAPPAVMLPMQITGTAACSGFAVRRFIRPARPKRYPAGERRRAAAGTASRRTGYQKRGSRMTGAPRCGLREKRRERVGGARGGTAARTRKARRGGGHALAFGFAVEEIANGLREAVRARDAAHGAFLREIGIRLREVEIARTGKARRGGGHEHAFGFAVEEIANGLRGAVRARDAAHGAFLREIGIRLREVEISRTGNNGAAEKRGLESIVPARVVQRAADED